MKKILAVFSAMLIIVSSFAALTAFAKESPTGKKKYKITITTNVGDEKSDFSYVRKGDKITVKVKEKYIKQGYKFIGWEIDGEYEIISGSLKSKKLSIKAKSDLEIRQIFDTESKGSKTKKNGSDKSPKTGETLPLVLLLGVLASTTAAAFVTKARSK